MTYWPDFSGARAKKERGFQFAKALMDQTGLLVDAPEPEMSPLNRIPVRLDYDPVTGDHVYRVTTWHSDATIRRWGLVSGDSVHNLRSALDHIVWQLACHKTGGPDLPGIPEPEKRAVQFPIVDTPTDAERADPESFRETNPGGRPGPLKHVLPEHRAIIYEHQPFGNRHNFSQPGVHPFTRLRGLSNDDKHRTITPMALITNYFYMPDVFEGVQGEIIERHHKEEHFQAAEPGAEVLRVRVWPPTIRRTLPNAGYVSPTPSFEETLPGGGRLSMPVYVALQMIGFQVKGVVDDFQDLFYSPEIFAMRYGS